MRLSQSYLLFYIDLAIEFGWKMLWGICFNSKSLNYKSTFKILKKWRVEVTGPLNMKINDFLKSFLFSEKT